MKELILVFESKIPNHLAKKIEKKGINFVGELKINIGGYETNFKFKEAGLEEEK